jgi:uncharacterized repeat protein (TIGR04052 family)
MKYTALFLSLACLLPAEEIRLRFQAKVGAEDLSCGKSYKAVGTTQSTITPRDFRFYIHDVRLLAEDGQEVPLKLRQDEKWQLDNLALLDFEDATGACGNGTPDKNDLVIGDVPAGHRFTGVKFILGVPFEKNHTDPSAAPAPLNLTALSWVWNAGRKFARLDFSSTGAPRGYAIHLGSTACTPSENKNAAPNTCANPNLAVVELRGFNPAKDAIVADLGALLADSNVDAAGKMMSGCMSGTQTPACGPLFLHLGLNFPNQERKPQDFFRSSSALVTKAAR